MKTIKPLMFALLAGLPLAAVPALAQTSSSVTTTTTPNTVAQDPANQAVPGTTYSEQSSMERAPISTHHDATGQTVEPSAGSSSGGGAK